MDVVGRLLSSIAAVALTIVLVGAGFIACVLPLSTQAFSNVYADDVTSAFTRSQLVKVADATRDYAFGSHDEQALYRELLSVDGEYLAEVKARGGKPERGFPDIQSIEGSTDVAQIAESLEGASDAFWYGPDVIAHLDACHAVAIGAYAVLALCTLVAAAASVACGLIGRSSLIGKVLVASGITTIAVFVAFGLWALIDFNGLFASFHAIFFPEGNWTFAADSLLICALPTGFWGAMGALWLIVSLALAALCVAGGFILKRRGSAHRSPRGKRKRQTSEV